MTTREDAVNAMKADNEFVSKKGDTEGLTKIMNAELNREFGPGKLRKSMRSANTDVIPELREHKSVPYGGGKEQRLTHGGKVVKTRVGNHDGKVGNSDPHERVVEEGFTNYEVEPDSEYDNNAARDRTCVSPEDGDIWSLSRQQQPAVAHNVWTTPAELPAAA